MVDFCIVFYLWEGFIMLDMVRGRCLLGGFNYGLCESGE